MKKETVEETQIYITVCVTIERERERERERAEKRERERESARSVLNKRLRGFAHISSSSSFFSTSFFSLPHSFTLALIATTL